MATPKKPKHVPETKEEFVARALRAREEQGLPPTPSPELMRKIARIMQPVQTGRAS